ncbi:MAG: HDIG domain-containing metalloprotein [Lachnospiraceae bacterium]
MSDTNKDMNPDALYAEIESHLLYDAKPSIYLEIIYHYRCFQQFPFTMLHNLKQVKQSAQYHPEGNVWNHTMLVVDEAAKRRDKSIHPAAFMWAALLHDIGKAPATKVRKGKITAYNHDKIGSELAREFLECFTSDDTIISEICSLIRYHMQILYVSKNPHMADIKAMKQAVDIQEVALLGLCDRLGRAHSDYEQEQENIRRFLRQVTS